MHHGIGGKSGSCSIGQFCDSERQIFVFGFVFSGFQLWHSGGGELWRHERAENSAFSTPGKSRPSYRAQSGSAADEFGHFARSCQTAPIAAMFECEVRASCPMALHRMRKSHLLRQRVPGDALDQRTRRRMRRRGKKPTLTLSLSNLHASNRVGIFSKIFPRS